MAMIVKGTNHELCVTSMPVADRSLEAFDNTKWSAINTCPTWGITRYQMHLRMPGGGRALALEAGHALHEVFAFVRLATLTDAVAEQRIRQCSQSNECKHLMQCMSCL